LPSLLGCQTETYNQEGAHQEASIGLLVELRAAMMENLDALVLFVLQDSIELETVTMHLGQV